MLHHLLVFGGILNLPAVEIFCVGIKRANKARVAKKGDRILNLSNDALIIFLSRKDAKTQRIIVREYL